jgi:hypothetical protein
VQVLGQLRANLELAFPGTIGLFTKLYSAISLAFLQRFPTAAKAAWLSPQRLASWLSLVRLWVAAAQPHDGPRVDVDDERDVDDPAPL